MVDLVLSRILASALHLWHGVFDLEYLDFMVNIFDKAIQSTSVFYL